MDTNNIVHAPHNAAQSELSLQATGDQYISVSEAARFVGLHPDTLHRKLRAGEIPGLVVLGTRFHRVSKPVLLAFLRGKAAEGKAA